jgi:hypothetical protein
MGVIEERVKPQKNEIALSVKDTSFIISAINRAQLSGVEIHQAYTTMHKLEAFHEFLLNKSNIIKGI